MRTLKIAAAALALALAATQVNAEPVTFGLEGGVSLPIGDYGDFVKSGPMVGGFADWWVQPEFAIGIDVVGNFHEAKDDIIAEMVAAGITNPELMFSATQFTLHAKWKPSPPAPATPWLGFGLGVYDGATTFKGSFAGIPFDSHDSANKFGVNVGVGVDFKAGETWAIGFAGSFHHVTDALDLIDPATGDTETKSAEYVSVGAALTFNLTGSRERQPRGYRPRLPRRRRY